MKKIQLPVVLHARELEGYGLSDLISMDRN